MNNILKKILKKEPIMEYITTGDNDLDKKILGYQKGELITIASRPGFGKTALALKSVVANIKECKKVYYITCGESSETIIARIIAQMLNIKINDLLLGTYTDVDEFEMQNALDIICGYLILQECSLMDNKWFDDIFKNMFHSELTVIDNINYSNIFDNMDSFRKLKEFAYDWKQPIIILTSIDINVEKRLDKRPRLLDITNAKYISEYSDKIIAIYSDDFYKEKSEAKKENISKIKGGDYKSRFINKPVIEKEIIVLRNNFGHNEKLRVEFHKSRGGFLDNKEIVIVLPSNEIDLWIV
jgi:replicative DNA helicase